MEHHTEHHTDHRASGEFMFSWLDTWWPALLIGFGLFCILFVGLFDPQTRQIGAGTNAMSGAPAAGPVSEASNSR